MDAFLQVGFLVVIGFLCLTNVLSILISCISRANYEAKAQRDFPFERKDYR